MLSTSFWSALGWDVMWEATTNLARCSSATGSTVSLTTQRMSNLDRIGSVKSTFSEKAMLGSYLPPIGLAAAMTAHLAWREVTIPALEMEIVCCSKPREWRFCLDRSSSQTRQSDKLPCRPGPGLQPREST